MSELLTPATLLALGLLSTTIIGALATAIVKIISALHEVAVVTGKIETAVNSKASVAEGREIALQQKVVLLEKVIIDKDATAGLLAQAAAGRVTIPAELAAGTTLDKIEIKAALTKEP